MAAARKTAAKAEEKPSGVEEAAAPETVDEVHSRGGWDVGYRGDRVDEADDDSYTVAGVLKAAQAADGE
ncbi:hypothetical protein AB0C77_06595 [Streptomyces sp. NPDC048629]|uniref:hypothetical protein n=1 Tax=Streptomyces sp. NPDC048629 TaxID=3154824 RepID=UPI0034296F6B